MNITLKKSNGKLFDGEIRYYHNNTDINDWKRDLSVDAVQKISLRIIELYLLESNKNVAPEHRLYAQNPALSKEVDAEGNLLYKVDTTTVQKALRYLMQMGVIKEMIYSDKDGNDYSWQGGNQDAWLNGFAGLTNRRIILNIKKAKELFTVTHKSKTFKEATAKGRVRRFIYRRPFSLKEYAEKLDQQNKKDIKDKVDALNDKKSKGYDAYLKLQMKKFGNFSELELVTSGTTKEIEIDNNILRMLNNFIDGRPLNSGISSSN